MATNFIIEGRRLCTVVLDFRTSECIAIIAECGTHQGESFFLLLSQLDKMVLWSTPFSPGMVISRTMKPL